MKLWPVISATALAALVAVTVVNCAWIEKVDSFPPSAYAPSPGYPCGNVRVFCEMVDAGDAGMVATCCPENTTCGGLPQSVGCSKDDGCCYIGSDGMGIGATHRRTVQPERVVQP